MSRYRVIGVALSVLLAPGVASAQSDSRWSADIYGSGGWSANPYAGIGGQAGYFQLGVRPRFDFLTQRNTLKIAADIQVQQYLRLYPTQDNYNATLDYDGRPFENVTTNAHASYANTIAGTFFDGSLIGPPTNPDVPPSTGTDIGLFGTGNRRQTIEGRGGFGLALSPRDRIFISGGGASTTNTELTRAANYVSYSGDLGFSRRFSDRLELGLTGSVTFTNYQGTFFRTKVYSGQATIDAQVTEHWKLTGAIGASYLDLGNGTARSTTISGNAHLCKDGEYDQICVGGSRAVLPSSTGGTRVQSALDGNYRRRITARGTINLHGSFTQVNRDPLSQIASNRYYAGSASYERTVNKRLRVTTSAFYRALTGPTNTNRDDFGGQIGFVFTVGDKR